YYANALQPALKHFSIHHIAQLKHIIKNSPREAAENWVDIANIFERFYVTKFEARTIGTEIVTSLRRMVAESGRRR
ncbi:hypothetical protein PFISCL1PPCAC_3745, partial [Pristionchus fissidentatus]